MGLEERDHCCGGKRPQNHGRPVWPHANYEEGRPTRRLKQGPPGDKHVPPLGQTAGCPASVGRWEKNLSVAHMKE